jgi:hypothetical protein
MSLSLSLSSIRKGAHCDTVRCDPQTPCMSLKRPNAIKHSSALAHQSVPILHNSSDYILARKPMGESCNVCLAVQTLVEP